MDNPQDHQSVFAQWLAANATWLWAASLGFIVRALRLLSKGGVSVKSIIVESLLIFFIIFGGAGMLQTYFHISEAASGGVGIIGGLCGAEFIRGEIINRLKAAFKAFGGNNGQK